MLVLLGVRLFAHNKALKRVIQLSIEADAQPKQLFLVKLALDSKKDEDVRENNCDCKRLNWAFNAAFVV